MSTNYYGGITNIPAAHGISNRQSLEVPYAPRWHEWFDDFNGYAAGDWVITTTEDGGNSATEAVADAGGGVLVLTNDIGDDDLDFFQSVAEIYTFEAGKRLYFETRLKFVEVIQMDAIFGLQVRDTSALAVSDGVWFQTDDGDALLDFHSAKVSSQSNSTGVYTLVADTYGVFAFYYDGVSSIEAWAGTTQTSMAHVATHGITTMPATELTVSFGHQAGEAVNAKVMSIDWIYVAKER